MVITLSSLNLASLTPSADLDDLYSLIDTYTTIILENLKTQSKEKRALQEDLMGGRGLPTLIYNLLWLINATIMYPYNNVGSD